MQQEAASATTGPELEQGTTALATAHRLKLRPPTFDGNYATFEELKYKFTAYIIHRLDGRHLPTAPRQIGSSSNRTHGGRSNTAGRRTMATASNRPEVHTHKLPPPEQQQQSADNTIMRWGWRSFDSSVKGSQYHWEHAASATSPNFSSQSSTTTTSRSPLQHGRSNLPGSNETTAQHYQTQSR